MSIHRLIDIYPHALSRKPYIAHHVKPLHELLTLKVVHILKGIHGSNCGEFVRQFYLQSLAKNIVTLQPKA